MGISSSKTVNDPGQFATRVTQEDEGLQPSKETWKAYDYVICGGGTAACVVASRLSENADVSVLLIEAGKSHKGNLMTRIPLAFTQLFETDANWKYETVEQHGLGGRSASWDRGKILGGSSSINASIYQRCSPEDFSEWAREGAIGWDAEEMKKYFIKAEIHTPNPDFSQVDAATHGTSGRSHTRYGPFASINEHIIETCVKAGIPRVSDMNSDKGPTGVSNFLGSVDTHGERSSAATAYLTDDVMMRPNLTVAVESMVTRLLFNDTAPNEARRASGVLLMNKRNGHLFAVSARREVIVSTGAIVTPQLLMLSGIGPAQDLKAHGIPVIHDLPMVGKGLLDHFSAGSLVVRAKAGHTWDHILRPIPGLAALTKWLVFGSGPLTSVAASVGVFVQSETISLPEKGKHNGHSLLDLSSVSSATPDIELFFTPLIVVNNGFTKTPEFNGLTIGCIALKPKSQGTITLKSSSIWDHPAIDPQYLSENHDLQVLLKATRLALHIARAAPLAGFLELPDDSHDQSTFFWPGDANPDTVSDEELTSWIKRNGQTAWHSTSSAKMGSSPLTSVVDPQLKVHGIAGLRIVDTSVFPTQVSGHPCAVVTALAEKAADLIKMAA